MAILQRNTEELLLLFVYYNKLIFHKHILINEVIIN